MNSDKLITIELEGTGNNSQELANLLRRLAYELESDGLVPTENLRDEYGDLVGSLKVE